MIVVAALLCGSLNGCAQMSSPFGGNSLAVDPSDPCGPARQRFAASQGYFTKEIVMHTVVGGLVGAGTGALIGAAAGGGRGALIGAAAGLGVGLAAGLASGYWAKLQQTNTDQAALAQQVNGDLREESTQMSETAAAFAAVRSCRFAEARRIKANARRGTLSRADAESQLAQEKTWFDQEIQAAQNAGINMQQRDDQFAYAANQLPRRGTGATAHAAATETIPQKRNSFDNTVKTAQAQSATTFSLDTAASWLGFDFGPAHA